MDIGFIGTGQMGRHMARNVLKAGYNLTVNDLRKEAAGELLANGARWAETPGEVAEASQLVISSLPTPQDVENIVYGPGGLKAGWKRGDIYIDMSTNSPATIHRIAADAKTAGVTVMDAPVSGGTKGAETGSLTIMVGGDEATLEKARPVLEAMGKRIFLVGDTGSGNAAKLVNNLIAIANTTVCAEGFVLGVKAGLDPQVLFDIISNGTGNSWALQQYPGTVFKGNWAPMYRLGLGLKDMTLAIQMGREYGSPLEIGALVEQKLIEAKAAGLDDKGIDAHILRLEEVAGVEVRTPEKRQEG